MLLCGFSEGAPGGAGALGRGGWRPGEDEAMPDSRGWDHHREQDKRYHDAIGTEYDQIVVTPRALLSDVLFRPFARTIRAGARMLDVGCGTGHMLRRFGHTFHTVTGVDHSRTMLQVAAASLAEQHVQAELIEADAIQFLTQATHSYDLITCVGFLHHLMPDMIPGVVQRMANLLAPSGGTLLLAEPLAVEAARLPPAIAKWNARSVAARQRYSQPAADPNEAPLSRNLLYASVDAAGLQVVGEQRTWEVFPYTDPPSVTDRIMTRYFTWRYGGSGNMLALLAARR